MGSRQMNQVLTRHNSKQFDRKFRKAKSSRKGLKSLSQEG